MLRFLRYTLLLLLGLTVGAAGYAQKRKIMNKPFIDTRRWHYGFNVGLHDQGLSLQNNGLINPETGEQWMAECDRQNFGFSVGVLGSLKINKWMDMRINPGLNFGSKHIQFVNIADGSRSSQDMKSTYIAVPVDFKFGAPRFNNYRPYVLAGATAQYDLTATKHTQLRCKPFQTYLEVGMGCDIYMPFFKLIPELKFCFGLGNVLQKKRNDITDPTQYIFTQSVDRASANMVILNLYFE
ncbi:MAG: porin family protein [Bacteroidales bacterium]|nr:porin family protein [Bacteroidales bacterium]